MEVIIFILGNFNYSDILLLLSSIIIGSSNIVGAFLMHFHFSLTRS